MPTVQFLLAKRCPAGRIGKLLYKRGHTLQQIVQELNEAGYRTRQGKYFFPVSAQRLLVRSLQVPLV